MAAGDGVIEEAGAKGEYGNYIRIRHANGYKTAYGHMSRYGAGVSAGVRVRQGQIIGYVGSTGLSSGPHCHFEVLVNGVQVNPMSIQVPNDRQLAGKDLADFKREKTRIDELMRRHPVSTRVATARPVDTGAPINPTRSSRKSSASETDPGLHQPAKRAADPGSARSRFSATAAAGMTGDEAKLRLSPARRLRPALRPGP